MGSFLFDRVQESMIEPFRGFTRPPAKRKPFHTMEVPGRVSPYNLSFSWRKKEGRRREELLRERFYRRSYWIPGSYASALSEKRNAFCKALEK